VSLTLAFELAAARHLADPETAVSEARTWSENVGIVSDRPPHVLTKFTRDNYIRNDVVPGTDPVDETLDHLREHFETDRFVFVTSDTDDAPDGWERQSIEEAAAQAGWEIVEESEMSTSADAPATRERDDWP
jgi:hypothetical protein